MHLIEYKYQEDKGGWNYSNIHFERTNLLVGDTGTGKTRFLNTIFNLGRVAVSREIDKYGKWKIIFEEGEKRYNWSLHIISNDKREPEISEDILIRIDSDGKKEIINRSKDKFIYGKETLPKLPKNVTSISLLRDEDEIAPIFHGFGSIMKRDFYSFFNKLEDQYDVLANWEINTFEKEKKLETLFHLERDINIKLYFVSVYFKDVFEKIVLKIKEIFGFITDIKVLDIQDELGGSRIQGKVPVFCIKEKNVSAWLKYGVLSAGMRKVITVITDSYLLPKGAIYLIDEYENSLGINAIDFLPSFILSEQTKNQFILTSHHPYIINKIPVDNWYIFNRKGSEVTIKFGKELKEKYSKSKQEAFIQLINDPFFNRGID